MKRRKQRAPVVFVKHPTLDTEMSVLLHTWPTYCAECLDTGHYAYADNRDEAIAHAIAGTQ